MFQINEQWINYSFIFVNHYFHQQQRLVISKLFIKNKSTISSSAFLFILHLLFHLFTSSFILHLCDQLVCFMDHPWRKNMLFHNNKERRRKILCNVLIWVNIYIVYLLWPYRSIFGCYLRELVFHYHFALTLTWNC